MARSLPIDSHSALCVALDVRSIALSDKQFDLLCRDNRELRFELSADGELIIMSPTFSGTGWRESKINQRLANWAEKDGTGISFGSSTGFTLPNRAKRSPDASWILRNRWERLTLKQQEREFSPICPDFVVELRSPTDQLTRLKRKMLEYIDNGARLGWLLDPIGKRVYIYRTGCEMEALNDPKLLSGETVLTGFQFNFHEIL